MPAVPPAASTKALILERHPQKWLDARVKEHQQKYKNVYPDNLMYWMIASQNKIAVADIKAGDSSAEGEEISIAAIEDLLNDEDSREEWTSVSDDGFKQPKKQAKFCIPSAVVVDMIRGTTSTGKPKIDVVINDGSGTIKVVAYAKAIDLFTEAKVKVGTVIRLPLVNGQYGHWTKKGGKGESDEEVLWFKLSLPPFGNVYKLDTPVTSVLKNLDQVLVRPKDACYVDGVVTNLDAKQNDICSKCFRWYDDKKANEHSKCKGAEILETTSYEGTISTTSGQIYKIIWGANARNGDLTVREPKIKVADDTVRIFGTLTEKNSVMVTGFKVIDPSEIQASEDSTDEDVEETPKSKVAPKRLPKAAAKPAPPEPEDDDEEEDEDEEEAPAPRRKVIQAVIPDDDDEEEEEAPAPRRRVTSPPAAQEAEEEEDEDEEAPSPPPRRRVTAKAPPVEQDDDEEEEGEDDAEEDDEAPAAPLPRRRVSKPTPPAEDEDEEAEEEDEEEPAPLPKKRNGVAKVVVVEEDEEEQPIVRMVQKKAKVATSDKMTEFLLSALTNFGTPQRIVILAKSAVKAGLVQCDDPKEVESLKAAFKPHLEAAIAAGAIKWADDKRQSVWIAK